MGGLLSLSFLPLRSGTVASIFRKDSGYQGQVLEASGNPTPGALASESGEATRTQIPLS